MGRQTHSGNDGLFVVSQNRFPGRAPTPPPSTPPSHLVGFSPPPSCCRSLGVGTGPPDCVRAKSEGAIWRLGASERRGVWAKLLFWRDQGSGGGAYFLTAIYLEQMISFRRMDYNIESITKRGFWARYCWSYRERNRGGDYNRSLEAVDTLFTPCVGHSLRNNIGEGKEEEKMIFCL